MDSDTQGAAPQPGPSPQEPPTAISADELRRRRRDAWLVIIIAMLVVTGIMVAKWQQAVDAHRLDNLAVDNLHLVQLIIERSRVDYDCCPQEDQLDLVVSEYFLDAPDRSGITNPYSGRPIQFVSFSGRTPGDITYIRIPAGKYQEGEITEDHYYLITYSAEHKLGYDINDDRSADGVLLVLESGWSHNFRTFPTELDTVWKAIQWSEGIEE